MSLEYKPDLTEVVDRHRRLWTRNFCDGILARLDPFEIPFDDPLSHCPDIEKMAAAWDHNYRARRSVQDDLLPVARVSFGSSAFGGFLGARVQFDGGAGWSIPLLESYAGLEQLHFDPENEWIKKQQQACRHYLQVAQGKFALCETEPMDGLNLVEVLRGGKVYLDLYDHPTELHHLLQFSVDFNIRLIEMQRQIIAPALYYEGGIFSLFRIWLPGRAPWMSVDTYGQCAPAIFDEFGMPYLQQTMDYFGGGWIHLHSSATHLLPGIIQLKGLLGIGVYDDPNAPRGFELLPKIRNITGDIPLQIDCTGTELAEGLRQGSLPGGVMYMARKGVTTIDEANRLMEHVRAYRS